MIRLILISALFISASAQARWIEGADVSDRGPRPSSSPAVSEGIVSRLQNRVSAWWGQIRGEAASSPSAPQRGLASQPVPNPQVSQAPTTTLNQQEVGQKAGLLPTYSTQGVREQVRQTVSADLEAVKKTNVTVVSRAAVPADPNLPKTKSGVVKFELSRKVEKVDRKTGKKSIQTLTVENLPALNVGQEAQLSRVDFQVQSYEARLSEFVEPKALVSPALISEGELTAALGAQVEMVPDARKLNVSAFGPDEKVSFETVRAIRWSPKSEQPIALAQVNLMSEDEMKHLQAEIMLESGKKCHLAAGLLYDLLDSENAPVKNEALHHLAVCLHKMGLFTESTKRMSDSFKVSSGARLAEALQVVVKDLPLEYEEDLRDELQRLAQTGQIPPDSKDAFHYIISKAAARSGHFGVAFEHAERVSSKFVNYWQAQFILAVADYSLGRQARAYERMKKLKQDLAKVPTQEDLASLVNINLGRMAFSEKKYSESVQYFRDIKKDHPMWVDALIEQGWSQLLAGDASGAIGNMYSLHAPFFKSVYKPESFVVRTIGYLNICQYGDAYRTLTTLEQEYRQSMEQIRQYRKTADAKKYYSSMVQYLRSPTTQVSVDGVPFQVWREIGRHRDFLNLQTAINNRVDELDQQKFISGLIDKDRSQVRWLIRKSQERLSDLGLKLKKAETNPELAKNINEWRRLRVNEENVQEALKFELSVLDRSAQKYSNLSKVAAERVQKRRAQMQLAAGEVLRNRMRNAENRLAAVIENNELLRYETFAGSGENIRYHATSTGQGDKVNNKRMPTQAKPESKELKWAFSGEYWADEIGHYRSSLKDNCAQSRQAATR